MKVESHSTTKLKLSSRSDPMTPEQILSDPNRVDILKAILERLRVNTDHMYELERKVEHLTKEDYTALLAKAFEQLEKHGLFGDTMWYCSKCKFRVTAKQNFLLGAGWVCCSCLTPVVKIADLDPIECKNDADKAKEDLQKLVREAAEQAKIMKKYKRRLRRYKKYGRLPYKNNVVREATRADRSIDL